MQNSQIKLSRNCHTFVTLCYADVQGIILTFAPGNRSITMNKS